MFEYAKTYLKNQVDEYSRLIKKKEQEINECESKLKNMTRLQKVNHSLKQERTFFKTIFIVCSGTILGTHILLPIIMPMLFSLSTIPVAYLEGFVDSVVLLYGIAFAVPEYKEFKTISKEKKRILKEEIDFQDMSLEDIEKEQKLLKVKVDSLIKEKYDLEISKSAPQSLINSINTIRPEIESLGIPFFLANNEQEFHEFTEKEKIGSEILKHYLEEKVDYANIHLESDNQDIHTNCGKKLSKTYGKNENS